MAQKVGYNERIKEITLICREHVVPKNDNGSSLVMQKEYWTKDGKYVGTVESTNLKIDI